MAGMDVFRFELRKSADDGDIQTVNGSGMPGEAFEGNHRLGFHGFGYNPPPGSHGVGISMHGRRDRAIIAGLEHSGKRQRNIPVGGACLYDAEGNVIRAYGDHGAINFPGKPFSMTCSTLTINFDGGVVTFGPDGIKHNGKNIGDTHIHGGIIPGPSDTGPPSN